MLDFPLTGKPIDKPTINPDSSEAFTQSSPATPATDAEISQEQTYTNPDLHRRIQAEEDRDAYNFATEYITSDIYKGAAFEISASATEEVQLCEYNDVSNWHRLIRGVDYLVHFIDVGTHVESRLLLLESSLIIPEIAEAGTKLRLTYLQKCEADEGIQPNDYSLEILDVNSYRTTITHLHQEVAGGVGENEIP